MYVERLKSKVAKLIEHFVFWDSRSINYGLTKIMRFDADTIGSIFAKVFYASKI